MHLRSQLLQIARKLTLSLDPAEVLHQITASARELLHADGCAVYMLGDDGHTLHPISASEPPYDDAILSAFLFRSFRSSSQGIALRVEAESIHLPVDIAMPCGLILNELVSNALKHAFPNGQAGTITVALRRADNGRVSLTVADTGVGLGAGVNLQQPQTLGLQLVAMLAEQIDATMDVVTQDGTHITLFFTPR
jgi:nitrate/nitrite-specific signal transduction histidine kinase